MTLWLLIKDEKWDDTFISNWSSSVLGGHLSSIRDRSTACEEKSWSPSEKSWAFVWKLNKWLRNAVAWSMIRTEYIYAERSLADGVMKSVDHVFGKYEYRWMPILGLCDARVNHTIKQPPFGQQRAISERTESVRSLRETGTAIALTSNHRCFSWNWTLHQNPSTGNTTGIRYQRRGVAIEKPSAAPSWTPMIFVSIEDLTAAVT